MKFIETELSGAFIVEAEPFEDERGSFARVWCQREFEAHGLNPRLVQCNISQNKKKGTLRGMHFQAAPSAEAKLVRCIRGGLCDVIIDLRAGSPAYGKWTAVELTADSPRMLYIPEGFAHGFQTLEDNTDVFYQMSEFYVPECAMGIRWNDPLFNIEWPLAAPILSDKDRNYPDFDPLVTN